MLERPKSKYRIGPLKQPSTAEIKQKTEFNKMLEKSRQNKRMEESRKSGLFYVHNEHDYVCYDKNSLFILNYNNPIRWSLVWLIEQKWFDRFITIVIILNSILFATHDFHERYDPTYESEFNKLEVEIDFVFSIIFIAECFIKILA